MCKSFGLILFVVAIAYQVQSLHLPSYIETCKISDPNFKECQKRNAEKALPRIFRGDKKYHVISTDPLVLPQVVIDAGSNLELSFTNLVTTGLTNLNIKDINFDVQKNHFDIMVDVPVVTFTGDYILNGKILSLPVKGEGPSNITMVDGTYHYSFDWNYVKKEGVKYMRIVNSNMDFELKRAYFTFDNLFNGDKQLGTQMNLVINDNWADVMKEVKGGISKTLSAVGDSIFKGYLENVPFNEILKD